MPVNFGDYDYVIAFKEEVISKNNKAEKKLPHELGRISAHVKDKSTGDKSLI